MGNTCKSMADSCQCMAKKKKNPLQYCKVISLQLIKKLGEKKKQKNKEESFVLRRETPSKTKLSREGGATCTRRAIERRSSGSDA